MSGPRVYVNRTGDTVSSPNTKEQLCEAVEWLAARNQQLRDDLACALDVVERLASAGSNVVAS